MILSGLEIKNKLGKEISIDPFDESCINPNSYNLKLYNELFIYNDEILDVRKNNSTKKIIIPESGILLKPGILYLGRTVEYTKTDRYVPVLEGRSSIGRLGLSVHITAGFGDVGFNGYWTLGLSCIHPIIIYPFIKICQICYHSIEGEYCKYISDKYQNNRGIQASMLYKENKDGDNFLNHYINQGHF
jgi:dCTP deaminase